MVVYAGTEPSAVFRSEDGGDRWCELTGLTCSTPVEFPAPPGDLNVGATRPPSNLFWPGISRGYRRLVGAGCGGWNDSA